MPGFENIVWEYWTAGGMIKVYGSQPSMTYNQSSIYEALATASRDGANPSKIAVLAPASTRNDVGYQLIKSPEYYSSDKLDRQRVDGVVLTKYGSAVCIPTGDCAVLALMHGQKVVAVHVGRAGLECFSGSNTCSANVVHHAYSFFTATQRAELHACIICTIDPVYFQHDDKRGQALVRPFFETYGERAFVGDPKVGRLDMVKIIRCQCIGFGTPPEQVIWDGLDTFSNPNLASHREQTAMNVPETEYQRNQIFVHHL
jgi:copper oxidase (laccase) domain-containing protein